MHDYAESLASRNTIFRTLKGGVVSAIRAKPAIKISIAGEEDLCTPKFYTTSDTIEGTITITAPQDIRFDGISITFEGASHTWLETYTGSNGRTRVSHTFLQLVQPIDDSVLPIPRIASKGQTYTFPFKFVIPERLLPSSCDHTTENDTVNDAHLHLPPTFGDARVLDRHGCPTDDYAPAMAQVTYVVRARVLRTRRESESQTVTLGEAYQKVAISPTFEDSPPIHVDDKSKEYVLRKSKDLRCGFIGKKLGRLSVFSEQPRPLRLRLNSLCPVSTTVTVTMTFSSTDPSIPPPTLGNLFAKLKVATFFSTSKMSYIPRHPQRELETTSYAGVYTGSTLLSTRCIAGVKWEDMGSKEYKADLVVPISTPKGKHLPPSFSSCHITRSYTLELVLSVHTSNHFQAKLKLKLPLQIGQPTENVDNDSAQIWISTATATTTTTTPRHPPPPVYELFCRPRIPEPIGISPGCE